MHVPEKVPGCSAKSIAMPASVDSDVEGLSNKALQVPRHVNNFPQEFLTSWCQGSIFGPADPCHSIVVCAEYVHAVPSQFHFGGKKAWEESS